MKRPTLATFLPLVFLLMPLRQLWLAWGWDRAAGLAGDGVFTSLYSGVQVRRWFTEGTWSQADLVVDGGTWLPEHLLAALSQAGLGALTDEGWAYGAMLIGLSFLAGYGPWRWLRQVRGETGVIGPSLWAALLLQLSPAVLRVGLVGDLGILGLGLLAMALSGRWRLSRGAWGLLAGLWSPATALFTVGAALFGRKPALLIAIVPLVLFWATPASQVPGSARPLPLPEAVGPAYVADNGAVLPLPPGEVEALSTAVSEATGPLDPSLPTSATPAHPGGFQPTMPALDPLAQAAQAAATMPAPSDLPARLPGGVSLCLGLLLALALGARLPALGALALGLGVVAVGGWWPPVGQSLVAAGPLALTVGTVVPGVLGLTGWSAWLVAPLLLLARGLAGIRWQAVLIVLLAFEALSESPLHSAQITPLAPQPATMALLGIPAGKVVVVPSPAAPYHQGQASRAELLFAAGRHHHPVPLGLQPHPAELPLVLELSRVMDVPVDLGLSRQAWERRDEDPWATAARAGFTAILIDQRGLDADTRQALDGAIARQVGTAFSSQGDYAVYGLVRLEGGP